MRRVVSLFRSTVGKKVLMAVSGTVLVLFLLAHMAGNLKVLQGQQAFDDYAAYLREVAYPMMPNSGILWIVRIVLLVAFVVHVVAAFQLWRKSSAAREHGYRKQESLSFSYASRTMRWGGVILLLFVIYHILHFTTGTVHEDFVHGAVYRNFVIAFRNPLVLAFYLLAQAALCLHIYHGVWSATQTLGASHPKFNGVRRPLAGVIALAIFLGFVVPPLLVAGGVIGDTIPVVGSGVTSDVAGEVAGAAH